MPDEQVTMLMMVNYVNQIMDQHDRGRHHDHDMAHVSLEDRLEREGTALVSALDRLTNKLDGLASQVNRFLGLGVAVVFLAPFVGIVLTRIWR